MEEVLKVVGPTAAVSIVAIMFGYKVTRMILNHILSAIKELTIAVRELTSMVECMKDKLK